MLYNGDALDCLKSMEPNSIDSLVTDPPAGISFMGKEWDDDKGGRKQWIAWMSEVMTECLRVMKPGAHGLVWALPRTSHWTATALEDAGFEVRDVVTHLFGTGFPKSMDISKAIDKQAGAERLATGEKTRGGVKPKGQFGADGVRFMPEADKWHEVTAPATDEAKKWQGFGTALKPASEHWILVRKPISEKTVASNVLKWGCGGLNIDGCRVEAQDLTALQKNWERTQSKANGEDIYQNGLKAIDLSDRAPTGRFPANLILDEQAAQALDEQSGILTSGKMAAGTKRRNLAGYSGPMPSVTGGETLGDSGGASRFFYVAKASKSDKGTDNTHPTVKSTKLMEYLIKLVTPPNGIVLDPFMGSGTTGVAARALGIPFVGIEKEPAYFAIAEKRASGS